MEKQVQRLILKDDDVLVVKIPMQWFRERRMAEIFYKQIKKKLLPRKNKVLLLPNEIELSVIGEKEIQEYVSNIDLWSLWDDGEEIDKEDI
jgi:hypothetical protein